MENPKDIWKREVNDFWQQPGQNLPVIPRLPDPYPEAPGSPAQKAVAICGECGRTVYAFEMYSCHNYRCPVQPKIYCQTSTTVAVAIGPCLTYNTAIGYKG